MGETMVSVDLKSLLARLSSYTKRSMEAAAGLCVSRGNPEVTPEHLLLVLVEDADRDVQTILRHFEIDPARLRRALTGTLDGLRTGNSGRPVFSPALIDWLSDAWMLASVELGLGEIRSGALLVALRRNPSRMAPGEVSDILEDLPADTLAKQFHDITAPSGETSSALRADKASGTTGEGAASGPGEDSNLAQYCINFTQKAREGGIDPVFGRDREIRQMVDILGRRRKNNPICVGEPGVGKTAVVEGLALKIAEGDVPDFLKDVDLWSLDLGLLQAGAGVKGEFENRLKGVIEEVKASPKPIVMFIDEAHTLIGAGGSAGGSDAANLLKPALARGELRTVAATTWSEYKKYFEKDPALARRFQLVKLDEPSVDNAVTVMRGLRGVYEKAHNVYVRDDAVAAAAAMSARYISGRQLPDKSVDVLDTACARVKLSLSTKPSEIDDRERRIAELQRTRDAIARDLSADQKHDDERVAEIDNQIDTLRTEIEERSAQWQKEKALVDRILELRRTLGVFGDPAMAKETPADEDAAEEAAAEDSAAGEEPFDEEALRQELVDKVAELRAMQGHTPLVDYEVTATTVGQVISDWTGVPVGSMVRDEAATVLGLADNLRGRIKGQDHAIDAIDEGLKAAKAGVNNPGQPMGVFLFVGPSGVGKTETATAVADEMFGGERFMVSINMSEFQEKHTVSRLVGSPPGYVGYGEGGVLTEAVRQRPYSVVLLDEVEKADLEVMNLFYQVFDKGTLSDGEGREIDFKNTIMFLTSNLATDILTELGTRDPRPSQAELLEAIRPTLSKHFKPALLARMQIVPFYPLIGDVLGDIVRLKMNKVVQRLRESQKLELQYEASVIEQIAARCTEVETGARNIDHIINRTLLPMIATEVLQMMSDGRAASGLRLGTADDGGFALTVIDGPVATADTAEAAE